MRLWSIHPKFLDSRGLVALWREGLLAQKVLAGKTKGYRHHPQLHRFQENQKPLAAIGFYLNEVANEAELRNYNFDRSKILIISRRTRLKVTKGQLRYESEHLLRKLKQRDPKRYAKYSKSKTFSPHPMFKPIAGKIEDWEKV